MKTLSSRYQVGAVNGMLIALIGMIVLVIATSSLAIWAYLNYSDQKNNVDAKVDVAVANAKKEQADLDEQKFAEREKEPNRQFVGPDDYGRLTFNYPKTWSVYVERDAARGGTYSALLNPVTVPPSSATQQFALRVTIDEQDYDRVLGRYEGQVRSGQLSSSTVSSNGQNGTRLDGNFTQNIRGSAVLFRVRDKTVTIRTDAEAFRPDFDALITTINFNQ